MKKELCRINDGKMVEGVCGGFAKYIGIDVSIVRFIWLLLCLAGGIGIWLYIISTITMPKEQNKNHHQRARRRDAALMWEWNVENLFNGG